MFDHFRTLCIEGLKPSSRGWIFLILQNIFTHVVQRVSWSRSCWRTLWTVSSQQRNKYGFQRCRWSVSSWDRDSYIQHRYGDSRFIKFNSRYFLCLWENSIDKTWLVEYCKRSGKFILEKHAFIRVCSQLFYVVFGFLGRPFTA